MSESYEALSPLALNTVRPATEWLNMGCWDVRRGFRAADNSTPPGFPMPAAVRAHRGSNNTALAELLYDAADIQPGARVLDVGCGAGDSLLVLRDTRAPRMLHGVTSLARQARRAQDRVRDSATVVCADAVAWLASPACTEEYDVILALDCAYHFHDRVAFIRHAHERLAPGGTLALVDLVAAWPYPATLISPLPPPMHAPSICARLQHRCTSYLSGTQPLVSFDTYEAQLRAAGFHVHMQDISHRVFPGFAAFLRHMGTGEEAAWRGGNTLQWAALRMLGWVVDGWARGGDAGMVRCALIVARTNASKHVNL